MNKDYKGFNLIWVIVIVVITSIISALTTGVIVFNNSRINDKLSYTDLTKDEDLEQFLEIYSEITSSYYEDVNKKELLEKAIAGMVNYLGDDYSTYLNNEASAQLIKELAGEYEGIGVRISSEDKSITDVFKNSPAEKAGIKVGDIIIGINNEDAINLSADKIVAIIGETTNEFILKLKRENEILEVSVKREKIISPSIEYKMLDNSKIGYLYIKTFSTTLESQVKSALSDLEKNGMESLVIDLRENTGGYLDAASKVSSLFLEKGKKIYSLDYKNEITTYEDETSEHRSYKIAILINGNTASASEILAAALKESYGAILIGETSFGKGKVQHTRKLDDGSMVKYTSAYWLTPSGICIDKKGLTPDYFILNEEIKNEDGTIEKIDNQLNKSIEILKEN